jgi:ankyrin repeat protein
VSPLSPSQNAHGNTVLHYCYAYKFRDVAEYLLCAGADDTIVNVVGVLW